MPRRVTEILTASQRAKRIRDKGKMLDYEAEALDSLARSWEHANPVCQALALADAQVYATLHLADMVRIGERGE